MLRAFDVQAQIIDFRRRLDRIWLRGLPVSTPSQAILDFALQCRMLRIGRRGAAECAANLLRV